jgi:hypothetical protein
MRVDSLQQTDESVRIDDGIVVEHPDPVSCQLESLLLPDGRTSGRSGIVFQTNDVDVAPAFLGRRVRDGGPIVHDDDPVGSTGAVQE